MLFAKRSRALESANLGIPVVFFDDDVLQFGASLGVGPSVARPRSSWSGFQQPPDWPLMRRLAQMTRPRDIASLIYTSGTTGKSKGAILTYQNINAFLTARANSCHSQGTRALSFLPLSHLAGQGWTIWILLAFGGQVWFNRGLPYLLDDLQECRPTTFFAPPRVYEGWFREFARTKGGVSDEEKAQLRSRLGLNHCGDLICAAAPIDMATLRWYHEMGLAVREVYGLSEVPIATSSALTRYKLGSVGKPEFQMTLRDGEILIKGAVVFQGYWNQRKWTALLRTDARRRYMF